MEDDIINYSTRIGIEDIVKDYDNFSGFAKKKLLLLASSDPQGFFSHVIDEPDTQNFSVFTLPTYDDMQVRVTLHVAQNNDETGTQCIDIPLRMIPYKKPADTNRLFDAKLCREIDTTNERIKKHNTYICNILTQFIKKNTCGTSANTIVPPAPAEEWYESRKKRMAIILNDEVKMLKLAIQYLSQLDIYAVKDYQIDDAVTLANNKAYEIALEAEKTSKRKRVKLPGKPPSWWSGNSEEPDSNGQHLMYAKGPTHVFFAPEVVIIEQPSTQIIEYD